MLVEKNVFNDIQFISHLITMQTNCLEDSCPCGTRTGLRGRVQQAPKGGRGTNWRQGWRAHEKHWNCWTKEVDLASCRYPCSDSWMAKVIPSTIYWDRVTLWWNNHVCEELWFFVMVRIGRLQRHDEFSVPKKFQSPVIKINIIDFG